MRGNEVRGDLLQNRKLHKFSLLLSPHSLHTQPRELFLLYHKNAYLIIYIGKRVHIKAICSQIETLFLLPSLKFVSPEKYLFINIFWLNIN